MYTSEAYREWAKTNTVWMQTVVIYTMIYGKCVVSARTYSELERSQGRAVDEHIGFYRDQICKVFVNSEPTLPPSPEDILTIWQSEHSLSCVLSLQAKLSITTWMESLSLSLTVTQLRSGSSNVTEPFIDNSCYLKICYFWYCSSEEASFNSFYDSLN